MTTADPYVTAKAGLRDNVKTLIAVFGGIAGVLLAGTPLSGYGSIDPFTERWFVASLALVVSLVLLGWCVRRLLFVLRPDLAYTSLLTDMASDAEQLAVQKEFAAHKKELLPKVDPNVPGSPQMDSLADLIAAKSAAWTHYQTDKTQLDRKAAYDRLADALALINHWGGFTRLHVRVSRGIDGVFWVGLLAILSIAVFALASNAPKKEAPSPPQVYVVTAPNPAATPLPAGTMPVLPAVLFAKGKFDLTPEAVAGITLAHKHLRTHPDVGILIFAHTDTVGAQPYNQALAGRRAERVVELLRSEGGISASRIFATPLAERDLPVLTTQDADNPANRSVEMILIPMPARRS